MPIRSLFDGMILMMSDYGYSSAGYDPDWDTPWNPNTGKKKPKKPSPPPPPSPTPPPAPTPGNDPAPGAPSEPGPEEWSDNGGGDDDDDGDGGGRPAGPSPEELWRRAMERLSQAFEELQPVQSPELLMDNPEDFADEKSEERIGAFMEFVSGEDWRQKYDTAVEAAKDLFERIQNQSAQSLNYTPIPQNMSYVDVNQSFPVDPSISPLLEAQLAAETEAEMLAEGRESGFGFTADTLDRLQTDPMLLAYLSENEGILAFDQEAVAQFFADKSADDLGDLYIQALTASAQEMGMTASFDGLSAQEAIEQYYAMTSERLEHIEIYGGMRVTRSGAAQQLGSGSYAASDWMVMSPEEYMRRENPDKPIWYPPVDMVTMLELQQQNMQGLYSTIVHRDVRDWALDYGIVDPTASLPEVEAAIRDYTYAMNTFYGLDVPEGTYHDDMTIPEFAQAHQQMLWGKHGEYDPLSQREFDPETGAPIPVLTDPAITGAIALYDEVQAAYAGQYDPIPKNAEQVMLEIATGIFFEPIDWILTARDVVNYVGKGDFGAALGTGLLAAMPFVPGSLGRLTNKLDNVPIGAIHNVADLTPGTGGGRGIRYTKEWDALPGRMVVQGSDQSCVPACGVQSLKEFGLSVSEERLYELMDTNSIVGTTSPTKAAAGLNQAIIGTNLEGILEYTGGLWDDSPPIEALNGWVERRGHVIVFINKHAVIVDEVDTVARTVRVRDPWGMRGPEISTVGSHGIMEWNVFKEAWDAMGNATVIPLFSSDDLPIPRG